jgi:type IX secretion system PorP/SprF family membrane protein
MFGEDKYWLGFSVHHLLEPQQGFYQGSNLPMKFSIHGGWNFYKVKETRTWEEKEETIFIPTFMYKAQNKFDQLDLGLYIIKAPWIIGGWFRGIAVKSDFKIWDRDALDLQVGRQFNNFSLTYSYDLTLSRLSMANTWGSHEISLVYIYCRKSDKKKPAKRIRKLPCPDFKRSIRHKWNFLGF